MELPEEVVLSLTCHGFIPVEETTPQQDPPMYKVPEDMTVTRVNMVVLGVCSIFDDRTANVISGYIHTLYANPSEENELAQARDELTIGKERLALVRDALTIGKQRGVRKVSKEPDMLGPDIQAFKDSADKPVEIIDYTDRPIIDKVFVRKGSDILDSKFNYRINVLNLNDETPDLFDIMKIPANDNGDMVVSTSQILEFLLGKNVKRVILFDFTCANFMTLDKPSGVIKGVHPETTRQLRRWMTTENQNGGKSRRRKSKKTKTRRGKKRRVQWNH